MKNLFHLMHRKNQKSLRGFVMPFTLLICSILLSVATSISIILVKELYFSKVSRDSQTAYYAADNGMMCATMIDDQYVDPDTGIGIFQYGLSPTPQDVLTKLNTLQGTSLTLSGGNSIKCGTSEIFNVDDPNNFLVTPGFVSPEGDNGVISTFTLRMSLDNTGSNYRCAKVTVKKTTTYRQIISQGYTTCPGGNTIPIERAIVSTTENVGDAVVGGEEAAGPSDSTVVHEVLTTGTAWTVPAGVSLIKVWAVGGGGGGAGSINSDATSGGGGGAGGVTYKVITVSPGDTIGYALGAAGGGGVNAANGSNGGQTNVLVNGVLTIAATGGYGGEYNNALPALGGNPSGGDGGATGGRGAAATGDHGGGGGGAIGPVDGGTNGNAGGNGAQATDIAGLFAALSAAGYPTTAPGLGADTSSTVSNAKNGAAATGFGSGGGGAGWYGGNGGNGLFGGGGGGAAGYTASGMTGGTGGSGAVVISTP